MTVKILMSGDGMFTPSGFGTISINLVPRLNNDPNIECAILSWQHTGNKIEWKGIKIYPIHGHPMGADSIEYAINDFKPDILITQGDLWMSNYLIGEKYQKLLKKNKTKWYWYLPIDTEIFPPAFKGIISIPDKIISMAKFAGELMHKEGIENWFIPHGVNNDIFHPLSEDIKQQIRSGGKYSNKDLSDKFVVGFVGRNQDRKQIPRLIRSFALFAKGKDDVHLQLHMDKFDPAGMSKDFQGTYYPGILNLIEFFGIKEKVDFTKGVLHYTNALTQENLNEVYNMMHLHASTTSGEGFGLTTIESLSAGIPNVITDYTSSKELVEGHGKLVPIIAQIWGSFGTWRGIVNEEEFAKALEEYYNDWKNGGNLLKEHSEASRKHAENYNWDKKIIPMWKEVLLEK